MTRRAAGLLTVEGDVRDYHPLDFERVPGFIASPPCQTFSAAGTSAGLAARRSTPSTLTWLKIADLG
ncbi:DNA cytosine methyltransferase [Amycolatopsis sp. lyj-109]|uniref:DNA cytosine methyltransferase n=1 Tax=Amycolatopsis sp. lyj-109 TaxID=2789287 RepID=UPI00397B74AB